MEMGTGPEWAFYTWSYKGSRYDIKLLSRHHIAGEYSAMQEWLARIPGWARRWISEVFCDSKSGVVVVSLTENYDPRLDEHHCPVAD